MTETRFAAARIRGQAIMEHRWGQRVTLALPVHLDAIGASGDGVLVDASVSGGFIETDLPLPVYSNLGVVVLVGCGAARRAVALAASVVRTGPSGVGVEWRDMGCPALLALLRGADTTLEHLTARDRVFN